MADILDLTTQIVTAYVANNVSSDAELPGLVRMVYQSLTSAVKLAEQPKPAEPVVPVKKSILDDHIVCLQCGGKFSILKRHLQTEHDLTVNEYRQKFSLPPDYPLVSPNYAVTRSRLAKSYGLGRKPEQRMKRR